MVMSGVCAACKLAMDEVEAEEERRRRRDGGLVELNALR